MASTRRRGMETGGVLLLILAAVWGLGGRADIRLGSLHLDQGAAVAGLAVVCVIAAAFAVRLFSGGLHRRSKEDAEHEHLVQIPMTPGERVQLVASAIVVTALAVGAVWLLGTHFGRGGGIAPPARVQRTTPSVSAHYSAHPQSQTLGDTGLWILLAALGVGVLVAVLVMLLRRAKRPPRAATTREAPPVPARRSSRITGDDDVRSTVIAAYRAFEDEAARRGIPIEPPETAQEIGQGAVGARIACPVAVRDLTRLFHRARYSSATLAASDRTDALRLLDQLREQMRSSS